MEESILISIKKMLGLQEEYSPFDTEIVIFINSAIFKLTQLGVGPSDGFEITGMNETWTDFLGDSRITLQAAKEFIYFEVRLAWDPPTQSGVINAWNDKLQELTWRLLHQVEAGETS